MITDYGPKALANISQPAKGVVYEDTTFGTRLVRLTDEADCKAASVAYSYWPTFNCDSTRLIIALDNLAMLYDFDPINLSFKKVGPLFRGDSMQFEGLSWSFNNPDLVFGLAGYQSNIKIRGFDVSRGQYVIEHDFTASGELPVGIAKQMSKARSNDRYFSFAWKSGEEADWRYAIVYDRELNKTYKTELPANFDECRLDRSGKYLLIATGRDFHVWEFEANATSIIRYDQIERAGGHYDLGDRALVHVDTFGFTGNRTIRVDLAAPHTWKQIFDCGVKDWGTDQHISMLGPNDTWALISSRTVPRDFSIPFTNEIFLVKTNGSGEVVRIAHHRSSNVSYEVMPKANLSPDGRFVAFNSDWFGGHQDVYIAALPDGLWGAASIPTIPTPIPTPQPPIIVSPPTPTPTEPIKPHQPKRTLEERKDNRREKRQEKRRKP